MSFIERGFSNEGGERMPPMTAGEGTPRDVPHLMEEVSNLTRSINRLLEDCSMELKATVSRKQWRIVDFKSVNQASWQTSVVARTYFPDKDLDEAFQTLLTTNKMFTEHLSYFLALLKGEAPLQIKETLTMSNQSSSLQANEPKLNRVVDQLDLSLLEDQNLLSTRRSTKNRQDSVSDVHRSFTDLMKAKINFDTKFLGFNAVFNGTNCSSMDSTKCLCQICSNVLGTVTEEKIISSLTAGPRRSKRINKTKRLTQRRVGRKGRKSNSLNKIDDQHLITNKGQESSIFF